MSKASHATPLRTTNRCCSDRLVRPEDKRGEGGERTRKDLQGAVTNVLGIVSLSRAYLLLEVAWRRDAKEEGRRSPHTQSFPHTSLTHYFLPNLFFYSRAYAFYHHHFSGRRPL